MQDGFFLRKKPFQGITFPLHQLENRYSCSWKREEYLRGKALGFDADCGTEVEALGYQVWPANRSLQP
jgi:hypothetical protein